MRKLGAWGVFAAVVLGTAGSPVRAVNQADIDGAIERGVEALRRQQAENGKWPREEIGATALAGLTLLECGAKEDDMAVQRAAVAIRKECVTLTKTYSIALSILFLDRLGDPDDVPLIESLMVRLLGGQNASGGWTYDCPSVSQEEVRRLQAKVNDRKELVGRRELPKGDAPKKTVKDLSPEIQQQLATLERGGGNPAAPGVGPGVGAGGGPEGGGMSDNSNTQFAALALWVGRRHGLPVEKAVDRLGARFRRSQMPNGGWMYIGITLPPEALAQMANRPQGMGLGMGVTASMTCAGVLSLAIADGATLEYIKERKPDAKLPDVSKDAHLNKGLLALGEVIEDPKGLAPHPGEPRRPDQRVGGRTYYFLWSLERVAVALDLKTIGKKDWYGWGAEILLDNQQPDGNWSGDYSLGGVDTCFALLFLKRANLARDLTGQLKGKVKDPGERVITVGGVGGSRLAGPRSKVSSGIEGGGGKPLAKPLQPDKAPDTEGGRLADALVKAPAERQPELISQMEKEKGSQYTEALAAAIPQLEGDARKKARDALAERLTRLKATSLTAYLQDEDPEIRRAAALAVAMKENKDLIPALVPLLRDPEESVVRAAHAALKSLTGQDFGPEPKASREDRDKAALKWLQWLKSKE